MEFRTKIKIEPSHYRINYSDRIMFLGSCFASSVGSKMEEGKMRVLINPAGTVYNPVSVINTLETIISGKQTEKDDLYFHNGMWLSLSHYTDFSSENQEVILDRINKNSKEALDFLGKASVLFITFGTARVFKWKVNGRIVSNCHRIPSGQFDRELLTVNDIVLRWNHQLDILHSLFPELKVVFTVSPVRHWKDGAHGNQISKSVLFLAIEELLKHVISPQYFPAYELLLDDLRDYRFFKDDMLHPSEAAINYIWEAFSSSYMESHTIHMLKEATGIVKATRHRISAESDSKIREFAGNILKQISRMEERVPEINLSVEKNYFSELLGKVGKR